MKSRNRVLYYGKKAAAFLPADPEFPQKFPHNGTGSGGFPHLQYR